MIICVFMIIFCTVLGQSNEKCGKQDIDGAVSVRIVDGSEFERGKWPWLTAHFHIKPDRLEEFQCGGCLITGDRVLTAAHCVRGESFDLNIKDIKVYFGAFDLSRLSGVLSASPSQILIHPRWLPKSNNYDGDVAMFKFRSGAIEYTSKTSIVQPICLWNGRGDIEKTSGIVAGWGQASEARSYENIPTELELPIVDHLTCLANNSKLANIASTRMFCAGTRNDPRGPCQGDSGSGFYVEHEGTFYLKGIVSASLLSKDFFCDVNNYALFSDVLKYRDWIDHPEHRVKEKPVCGMLSERFDVKAIPQTLSFPWSVALFVNNDGKFSYSGSGAVISDHHVVSSATPVSFLDKSNVYVPIDASRLRVYVKIKNLLEKDSSNEAVQANVAKIALDPNIKDGFPREGNIAVIHLNVKLIFGSTFVPICLDKDAGNVVGKTVISSGYKNDVQSVMPFKIRDKETCDAFYDGSLKKTKSKMSFICASSKNREVTCHQDDPIYFRKEDGKWIFFGIFSLSYQFQNRSCNTGKPFLYEKALGVVEWINDQMVEKY